MTAMSAHRLILAGFLAVTVSFADAQQPPKTDRTGSPVCIVRNESTMQTVIEYRSNNEWQQVTIAPGKDASIAGDRIRVATTREDKAIITVDLPVQAGKKYRLVWNKQSSMWDFSPVT